MAGAIAALSEIFGELQRAAGATERIIEILRSEDPVTKPEISKKIHFGDDIAIEFNKVTFSYPLRPQDKILDQLCFSLKEGETLALVGSSGAGKSSIFQLLLRFYEFQHGIIKIGSSSIKEIDSVNLNKRSA